MILKHSSHPLICDLFLTTIPLCNKYLYKLFALETLTNKKFESEGYTFFTNGKFSNFFSSLFLSRIVSFICELFRYVEEIFSIAFFSVNELTLYGGFTFFR